MALLLAVITTALVAAVASRPAETSAAPPALRETYQGKPITWWAARAVQARRDANARRATIRRLRRTIASSPTIQTCVAAATIAYPRFTVDRAWRIIRHESQGDPNAKNRSSTASGLYQFLTSTWASTPYGRLSIWDPCAQSLAAGWMHEHGRGGEWAIG